jgi:hypothetical protein
LVTISTPAIEPAISTLPVKNQLIANVSSVPNVRQLTALRIDLVCVSAPRNKVTRHASLLDDHRTYHAARIVRCHVYIGVLHRSPESENLARQNHPWTRRTIACNLAEENLENSLI